MSAPPPGGILITRPEPAASATASLLGGRGYQVQVAPMLVIEPVPKLPVLRVQAILATSANALPALSAYDETTRILAVGDATASQALAMGFRRVLSAGRDAEALAQLARDQLNPKTVRCCWSAAAGRDCHWRWICARADFASFAAWPIAG